MLYVNTQGALDFCQYRVTFDHNDSAQEKFENDPRKWVKFQGQWPDLTKLETRVLKPTTEQQTRLEEISTGLSKEDADQYLTELTEYVRFGAVEDETECPFLQSLAGTPEAVEGQMAALRHSLDMRLCYVRYQEETGGLELSDGTLVETTREHQAQLNSVYNTIENGLASEVHFKSPEGWVKATDVSQIKPYIQPVTDHVQASFSAEEVVSDQITAAETVEELENIDVEEAYTTALNQ